MFDVLKPFARVLKRKRAIDNFACWLHHCLTSSLLMLFAVLVTAQQYVGDPIDCYVKGLNFNGADRFCWVQSTFTMPNLAAEAQPGVGVVGFDLSDGLLVATIAPEPKYHQYYQWVWLVLVIQAAVTYFPYHVWKAFGGSVILSTLEDYLNEKKKQSVLMERVVYFAGGSKVLAVGYFLCEALYLVLDVAQMFLMDRFLGGEFFSHGFEVLWRSYRNQEERDDHLVFVFPRVTKCIFRTIGPSGSVQTQELLCVLPVNATNEMIYIFLWFWYFVLAAVAAINLTYHFILMYSRHLRRFRLKILLGGKNGDVVDFVLDNANFGQFFLVLSLKRNMRSSAFKYLLKTLKEGFKKKQESNSQKIRYKDRNQIKTQQSPPMLQRGALDEGKQTGWVNVMPTPMSPTTGPKKYLAVYTKESDLLRRIIPENPLDRRDEMLTAFESSGQGESQIRQQASEDLKTDRSRGTRRTNEFHTFQSQRIEKDMASQLDCIGSLPGANLTIADLYKGYGIDNTGGRGKVLRPGEMTLPMERKNVVTNSGNREADVENGRLPKYQETLIDLESGKGNNETTKEQGN